MQAPEEVDLAPIDHKIKRTFRNRRSGQCQVKRMVDNQNQPQNQAQGQVHNQLSQSNQHRAIQNEAPILVGDYVNPISTPVQPVVVYPPFGQPNFHLRPHVINLFQNNQDIRFFGKFMENPHEHISTFLMLYDVISYEGISVDTF